MQCGPQRISAEQPRAAPADGCDRAAGGRGGCRLKKNSRRAEGAGCGRWSGCCRRVPSARSRRRGGRLHLARGLIVRRGEGLGSCSQLGGVESPAEGAGQADCGLSGREPLAGGYRVCARPREFAALAAVAAHMAGGAGAVSGVGVAWGGRAEGGRVVGGGRSLAAVSAQFRLASGAGSVISRATRTGRPGGRRGADPTPTQWPELLDRAQRAQEEDVDRCQNFGASEGEEDRALSMQPRDASPTRWRNRCRDGAAAGSAALKLSRITFPGEGRSAVNVSRVTSRAVIGANGASLACNAGKAVLHASGDANLRITFPSTPDDPERCADCARGFELRRPVDRPPLTVCPRAAARAQGDFANQHAGG